MLRLSLAVIVGLVVAGAALLFAPLSFAAPLAQALLPNFITTAQTTIAVTIILADGQTILVPIGLEFVNRHEERGGYLSLVATVAQQPDMFIAVQESGVISASMQAIVYVATQPPQPIVVATPTPTLAPLVVVLTPTPLPAPVATNTSIPAPPPTFTPLPAVVAPIQAIGPTIPQVCEANTGDMTDPQIAAFANQFVGQAFEGWEIWVYDVVSNADGTYNLALSKEERWMFWGRNIIIENIPADLAARLNVNQKLILSGRIARNETFLDSICNPLVVDNFRLQE